MVTRRAREYKAHPRREIDVSGPLNRGMRFFFDMTEERSLVEQAFDAGSRHVERREHHLNHQHSNE
jgi:hypothetical protein